MGKNNIYLWTGTGAGKTTSALGVALRCLGHNKKVVIIQFMKGRKDIGEYKIRKKLGKNYKIYQFGKKGWVNLKKPDESDKKQAEKGLMFAERMLKEKPDLLVLDEINLAAAIGLLKVKDILRLLNKAPEKTNVYLIGRYAPKELIKRADFVNEVIEVKHPKYWKAKKGIEY